MQVDARLVEICHVVHTLVVINLLVLSVYHLEDGNGNQDMYQGQSQ